MYHEVSEEEKEQLSTLVGALCIKSLKVIKRAYPHLKGDELHDWHRMFVYWMMMKDCFDRFIPELLAKESATHE